MHLYTKMISHKGDKIMTHRIYKKYKPFIDAKRMRREKQLHRKEDHYLLEQFPK